MDGGPSRAIAVKSTSKWDRPLLLCCRVLFHGFVSLKRPPCFWGVGTRGWPFPLFHSIQPIARHLATVLQGCGPALRAGSAAGPVLGSHFQCIEGSVARGWPGVCPFC